MKNQRKEIHPRERITPSSLNLPTCRWTRKAQKSPLVSEGILESCAASIRCSRSCGINPAPRLGAERGLQSAGRLLSEGALASPPPERGLQSAGKLVSEGDFGILQGSVHCSRSCGINPTPRLGVERGLESAGRFAMAEVSESRRRACAMLTFLRDKSRAPFRSGAQT